MFCSNCGKQIPEDAMFCSHCGARQAAGNHVNPAPDQQNYTPQTTGNQQPVFTPPQPKKASPKKTIGVIITLATILVVFFVGRFVVAPAMLRNSGGNSGDSGDSSHHAQQFGSTDYAYKETKTKIYVIQAEHLMSSQVTLICHDDVVASIIGFSGVYDLSAFDVDELKKDVASAKEEARQNGLEDVEIRETEGSSTYSVNFSFTHLDRAGSEKAVELAAKFMGFTAENGKIHIGATEKILRDNGFSLKEEI